MAFRKRADDCLSMAEACKALGYSPATLRRLEAAGLIAVVRPPIGKPRILRSELRAFLERNRSGPATGPARPPDRPDAGPSHLRPGAI